MSSLTSGHDHVVTPYFYDRTCGYPRHPRPIFRWSTPTTLLVTSRVTCLCPTYWFFLNITHIRTTTHMVGHMTLYWSPSGTWGEQVRQSEVEVGLLWGELLKLQENVQFPDEPVKIDGTQIHSTDVQKSRALPTDLYRYVTLFKFLTLHNLYTFVHRDEVRGCQGPSHTGLSIIRGIFIHRFNRRSLKPLWGSAAETEEPECKWEKGAWVWEGWVYVCYSTAVRYRLAIWSRKSKYTRPGGLVCAKQTKGCGCVWHSVTVRYSTVIKQDLVCLFPSE